MFSNFTIKTKLSLLVAVGMVLLGALVAIFAIQKAQSSLTDSRLEQLTSIRASKQNHIQDYIGSLQSLITSMANSATVKESFEGFERGFYTLQDEIEIDTNSIKPQMINHYENKYLNSVNYDIPNSAQKKSTSEYLPKDINGLIAQYIFIVNNSANIGEKNNLINDDRYSSVYMTTHKKYHPTFDKYLNSYGLYDIFMVDLKGNLIYTDFKEKDYATNLQSGVYSNTGIARAYNRAKSMSEGEIAFDDFATYEPSYNMPASFIATPIYIDGTKRGVLIFQMPIDKINHIMSFGGKYKEAGLGESGECYLVGGDYKMRNDSRFVKDISDTIIKKAGTTIGLFEVKTDSTKNGLSGKSDTWIIDDYRGISVLSSYSTLDIFGTKWAIIAEIDEEEALNETVTLRNMIIIITLIVVAIVLSIFMIIVKSMIFKPLESFQGGLLEFFAYLNREKSDVDEIKIDSNDEIGVMAKAVNQNIAKTKVGIQEDRAIIDETIEVLTEFEQGDLCQRLNMSVQNPALMQLKDILNKMAGNLENNIDSVLNVLESYSNYNYLATVDKNGLKAHLEKLANGVNTLGESITNMLVENKQNGLVLESDSHKLTKYVERLNTSANQQAASLEETAASIEQMSGNIEHSTQKAQQMKEKSLMTQKSANEGKELAQKTASAMEEINSSTSSINEAITIIDQIAFQTNILSLNAAVEAATAGEAGKGFAVVAGEVRNLASRSAEAAKAIKNLVEEATSKTSEGKAISAKMISGYETLSTIIAQNTELIEDVANATSEQLQGINQINTAISQLDQATQENAKVAGETNDIANQASNIASTVVKSANEKEFRGKDNIDLPKENYKVKEIKKDTKQNTNHINSETKWDSF
jgi:methyl-accepting chemotaxis protein